MVRYLFVQIWHVAFFVMQTPLVFGITIGLREIDGDGKVEIRSAANVVEEPIFPLDFGEGQCTAVLVIVTFNLV